MHSWHSYGLGPLIGIYFHPLTAEKIAPPCMARLDVANCRHLKTAFQQRVKTILKASIFRAMVDTAWFESKSEEDKLAHLSKLMYSSEENEFKTLLSLVPVDLVTTIAEKWGGSKKYLTWISLISR